MTAPAAGNGRDGRALVRGVDYVPDSFDGSDDEDLGDEEVLSVRVEGDEKVAEFCRNGEKKTRLVLPVLSHVAVVTILPRYLRFCWARLTLP
jgi:hypothetical protein